MVQPSKRKHSAVVAKLYEAARQPFDHLKPDQLEEAVRTYRAKVEVQKSLPVHIQVIQKLGILDVNRGYTEEEVEKYLKVRELAETEIQDPSAFISEKTESALQSIRSSKNRKRSKADYVDIWDYVEPKLRRGEMKKSTLIDAEKFFEARGFSQKKIERAITWALKNQKNLSSDS